MRGIISTIPRNLPDILIACALRPEKEGEFLDNIEPGVERRPRDYTEGDFLRELGSTLEQPLTLITLKQF